MTDEPQEDVIAAFVEPKFGTLPNESLLTPSIASIGGAIAFVKQYGPLIKFIAGFFASNGDERKWLEAALNDISQQLDTLIGMIADLTYEIELLRSEIQRTPISTLHVFVEARVAGILSRFETLAAGESPITGEREALLRAVFEDAFSVTHEIAGSPREFALIAPVAGLIAPVTITSSLLLPNSSQEIRKETISKLRQFAEFSLDSNQASSLAWIAKNRDDSVVAREQSIDFHSRPVVKRHWFYSNGDKIHHSARISFQGDPSSNFSHSIEEIEDRAVELRDRGDGGGGGGGRIFNTLAALQPGDREIPGRQKTQSKRRAERRYREIAGREVDLLNGHSTRWRTENLEKELANDVLVAASELPGLLDALDRIS